MRSELDERFSPRDYPQLWSELREPTGGNNFGRIASGGDSAWE